jgi:hypothetical protein
VGSEGPRRSGSRGSELYCAHLLFLLPYGPLPVPCPDIRVYNMFLIWHELKHNNCACPCYIFLSFSFVLWRREYTQSCIEQPDSCHIRSRYYVAVLKKLDTPKNLFRLCSVIPIIYESDDIGKNLEELSLAWDLNPPNPTQSTWIES